MCRAPWSERGRVRPAAPEAPQRAGVSGMGGPPVPWSPRHPPAHAGFCSPPLRGAWEGWQHAAEEWAALQACRREENNFFALFFPLLCPSLVCECRDLKELCPGAIVPGWWLWG